ADLAGQVRARVTARRRRRAVAGTTGVAACAAALLTVALTLPTGSAPSAPVPTTGPAASSSVQPPATGTSTPPETPWWPLAEAGSTAPPHAVVSLWDARGPHSDVRQLHQDYVGGQLVLLIVGRDSAGQDRMALVQGRSDGLGGLYSTGLKLLQDLPRPNDPTAPLALAFGSGTASTIEVLAPPCSGTAWYSSDRDNSPLALHRDGNQISALLSKQLDSAELPHVMTIECGSTTGSATKAAPFALTLQFAVPVTDNATVYLFDTD
ncbi:hypothetical protein ACEZCY_34655, partial [Streptacidiphilus sp. N1-12]